MQVKDLIYGGESYKNELQILFPDAKIEDASDEVHRGRISLEIEDIAEKEYWKKICLNGFMEMSMIFKFILIDKKRREELITEIQKWKTED